jgi:hypothetical protein
MAELIREHHAHIHTPEGVTYTPRTYAVQLASGTWEAWLEFHPLDSSAPVLGTDRETSQASRDAVEVWASGLEAVYFEGAFARAQVVAGK